MALFNDKESKKALMEIKKLGEDNIATAFGALVHELALPARKSSEELKKRAGYCLIFMVPTILEGYGMDAEELMEDENVDAFFNSVMDDNFEELLRPIMDRYHDYLASK